MGKPEEKIEMKSYEFDDIATNVFGKAYPVIAKQAIENTGIDSGICVDLGCGGGHLGIALAEDTDMKVFLYDMLDDAIDICNKRINDRGLEDRVCAVKGDVEDIILDDGSVDLAVSRGSLWFWEDKVKAFREIHRILKKGGKAYLGGGFGTKEIKAEIDRKMAERGSEPCPGEKIKKKVEQTKSEMIQVLDQASIKAFEIIDGEIGYWVVISKEE